MKKTILSIIILMAATRVAAQTRLPEYDSYIDTYKQFAIDSRERYGIPAAITIAQGILESGAGNSPLATECNNHFGIKCGSSWYGKTMNKDDDSANECFRCYNSAQASFDDHSEFLKRQRYAFLFDYAVTDYGLWAQGLRQAGYATDPAYPQKLITIIETYELYLLDQGKNLGLSQSATKTDGNDKAHTIASDKTADKQTSPAKKTDQSRQVAKASAAVTIAANESSEKDNSTDEQKANLVNNPKTVKVGDVIVDKTATYSVTENNGVKCIQLTSEASFRRIAKLFNINIDRLLYLNDLPEAIPLHSGDWVYLSYKKGQADKSLSVYTVKSGDSMYSIAQEFGIRLSALYKLNDMEYGTPARVGQQLKLHR